MISKPALLAAFLLVVPLANAATLESKDLVLLQPEVSIEEKNPDPKAMAQYIRAVQDALRDAARGVEAQPTAGFVAIAVRSGKRTNAWLDVTPSAPSELANRLLASVRAVPGFDVAKGTLVFAIKISIGGAAMPTTGVPHPEAWTTALSESGKPMEIEALVDKVWP